MTEAGNPGAGEEFQEAGDLEGGTEEGQWEDAQGGPPQVFSAPPGAPPPGRVIEISKDEFDAILGERDKAQQALANANADNQQLSKDLEDERKLKERWMQDAKAAKAGQEPRSKGAIVSAVIVALAIGVITGALVVEPVKVAKEKPAAPAPVEKGIAPTLGTLETLVEERIEELQGGIEKDWRDLPLESPPLKTDLMIVRYLREASEILESENGGGFTGEQLAKLREGRDKIAAKFFEKFYLASFKDDLERLKGTLAEKELGKALTAVTDALKESNREMGILLYMMQDLTSIVKKPMH